MVTGQPNSAGLASPLECRLTADCNSVFPPNKSRTTTAEDKHHKLLPVHGNTSGEAHIKHQSCTVRHEQDEEKEKMEMLL